MFALSCSDNIHRFGLGFDSKQPVRPFLKNPIQLAWKLELCHHMGRISRLSSRVIEPLVLYTNNRFELYAFMKVHISDWPF